MSPRDAERVERAIRYLDAHYRSQPPLDQVAAAAGLSTYHFQRVFKRWAGVSPKRFLQFLTVEHAKTALREGQSVLNTAYDAGLSGPGRLHDLFVAVEAVTPGEFKDAGAGLSIRYGFQDSRFGECMLAATDRGICRLAFSADSDRGHLVTELGRAWPGASLQEDALGTRALARRVFAGPGSEHSPLTLVLRGTNFQLKVWEALLRIPPGALASYSDVARSIGRPHAQRAVGTAVGQNPIAYLIPCHRVIRSTGAFGSYRWGATRKKAIVGWEAACRERLIAPVVS